MTVSYESKWKQTMILTQNLLGYRRLVYIKNEPGQYFIEQILIEIPNKAYYNNISKKAMQIFWASPYYL